jgi:hypothetical protein
MSVRIEKIKREWYVCIILKYVHVAQNEFAQLLSVKCGGAQWSSGQCGQRAIAEAKQRL